MTRVFVSPYKNPFINLALEDFFLRGGADLPVVFFYVNRPCVVFGRFQNPWIEAHLPYLANNDIWPVRRQSGGGCVFHDEGNLNFSHLIPGGILKRDDFLKTIQRAFLRADIPLEISPRNDLFLYGKKISGSAFKQTKEASFHHGTFLVNSDLMKLDESLKHTIVPKSSKSIASVRSQVTTLQEHFPYVEIEDVMEIIASEFQAKLEFLDGTLLSHPELQKSFEHLRSSDWLWGETPAFELKEGMSVRKAQLEAPYKGSFSKENLKDHLSIEELKRLFPDFSELHRLSNLIF